MQAAVFAINYALCLTYSRIFATLGHVSDFGLCKIYLQIRHNDAAPKPKSVRMYIFISQLWSTELPFPETNISSPPPKKLDVWKYGSVPLKREPGSRRIRGFLALGTTWPIERLTEELAQFRPWFLECLESSATGEFLRIDLLGDFLTVPKKAGADLNPQKMGSSHIKTFFFVKDIILIHLATCPRRQAWANRSVRKLRPASSRRCRCRCRWFPAKIYRSRRSLGGFVGEMVGEKM